MTEPKTVTGSTQIRLPGNFNSRYVALCREVRVKLRDARAKFIQPGDWYVNPDNFGGPFLYAGSADYYRWGEGPFRFWIPRLDQLLDLLENDPRFADRGPGGGGGYQHVSLCRHYDGSWECWADDDNDGAGHGGIGSSREEAALNLYLRLLPDEEDA